MNKNTLIKISKVSFIVIICVFIFLGLFKLSSDYLINYMNENHFGEIVISDEYSVLKISKGKSTLDCSDADGVNETDNITKVGWNKRFIIYKTEAGFAYVDMYLNERTYFVESDLNSIIENCSHEGKLELKNVEEFYPETRAQ